MKRSPGRRWMPVRALLMLAGTLLAGALPAQANPRILLQPWMLTNESGDIAADKLIDEQDRVGDPESFVGNTKTRNGGKMTSAWRPSYNTAFYWPESVAIDLGAMYHVTGVYFYDSNGTGGLKFAAGQPFAWTTLFTTNQDKYQAWDGQAVDVTARYLEVTITDPGAIPTELAVYGTPVGEPGSLPRPGTQASPTFDQFVGVNAFIDDPPERIAVAGSLREYHDWQWDEGNGSASYPGYPKNQNAWAPSTVTPAWNFDAYYLGLNARGITICPCVEDNAPFLAAGKSNAHKPILADSGRDPLLPASYVEHADHLFQYSARYGAARVAASLLKLAPNQRPVSGAGTVRYIEDWNEQDRDWQGRDAYFKPYEYAAMGSADRDGHQGAMGATLGAKQADPTMKFVMAGVATMNLDYLKALKLWCDFNRGGSFAWDVINVHHYSSDAPAHKGLPTVGVSPEADGLRELAASFCDYRDRYLPGKELWVTEFGYDTHPQSVQRAPAIGAFSSEEVQGQWILRTYLALAAAGIDRAYMYMLRDVDATSVTKYNSSGLVSSMSTGWKPKRSWYYLAGLRAALTGLRFFDEPDSGNASVRIYRFRDTPSHLMAYVVWCPTQNQTTVGGYRLTLPAGCTAPRLITLSPTTNIGAGTALSVTNGGVSVDVSELPMIVSLGLDAPAPVPGSHRP